jgi:hypothetical protein
MYSLSLLIVELETARTTLLGVFEVSNDTPEYRGVLYIEMVAKVMRRPISPRCKS